MAAITSNYEELIRSNRKQALVEADRNVVSLQNENLAVQSLLQTSRDRISELEDSIQRMTEFHAVELHHLQTQRDNEIDTLRNQFETRLNETIETHSRDILALKESKDRDISQMSLEHETQIDLTRLRLQSQYEREIGILKSRLQNDNLNHENEIALYEQHTAQVNDTNQQLLTRSESLKQSLDEALQSNQLLEDQMQSQKRKQDDAISALKAAQEIEMTRFEHS